MPHTEKKIERLKTEISRLTSEVSRLQRLNTTLSDEKEMLDEILDRLAETKFMRFVSILTNDYPSYDLYEPKTIEERRSAAKACKAKLLGDMPVYVDNMDNKVNQTYVGWPTRIYFIDKKGQVQYDSGLGPYGLSPEELQGELSTYLSK